MRDIHSEIKRLLAEGCRIAMLNDDGWNLVETDEQRAIVNADPAGEYLWNLHVCKQCDTGYIRKAHGGGCSLGAGDHCQNHHLPPADDDSPKVELAGRPPLDTGGGAMAQPTNPATGAVPGGHFGVSGIRGLG